MFEDSKKQSNNDGAKTRRKKGCVKDRRDRLIGHHLCMCWVNRPPPTSLLDGFVAERSGRGVALVYSRSHGREGDRLGRSSGNLPTDRSWVSSGTSSEATSTQPHQEVLKATSPRACSSPQLRLAALVRGVVPKVALSLL